MTRFEEAYKKLNSQQKLAVDAIDGPVMVIAGPGTGKTQLLSVRVANILAKTDSLPDNILCLTFTEAAATEMRDRLVSLIGQSGYDVNVMTFHSFGTEIINRYPDYFFFGANMQPIDEVSSYSILQNIFSKLPHSNPLAIKYFDEYTYLSDSQKAIGQLKKAAIPPEDLREMLKQQSEFIEFAEPIIIEAFNDGRVSKKTIPKLQAALDKLESYSLAEPFFMASLRLASESETTPPISAWKRQWIEKNGKDQLVLKDRKRIKKLQAMAEVYEQYQTQLAQGYWFDYDDMVMQVVDQLTNNEQLRAELQEQYLYMLVDEFQDTNDAQLKLMKLLADNPVNEARPNILVVGDDDQAIYKFQGADITNMHQFASWVNSPLVVPLTDIYRYSKPLLDLSRNVIDNAQERLTDQIDGINKELKAIPTHEFDIARLSFEDEYAEYDNIAKLIADEINSGTDPKSIAVIARQHGHLEKFAEYASKHSIPLVYDRQDDILASPIIKELLHFAEVVCLIAKGRRKQANALMPELLSFRFWGIEPVDLWKMNAQVDRSVDETWLDIMIEDKLLNPIATFLLDLAQSANNDPLNITLSKMIGSPDGYFYKYFFDTKNNIDSNYLQLIANLKTLYQKVSQYAGEDSSLQAVLDYVALQNSAKLRLLSHSPVSQAESAVSLLTAHGAKGQEFDNVYILHAQDSVWGAGRRGQSSKLSWTSNLNISPAGDNHDDRVRLFYVALTRAKHKLTLASSRTYQNKASLPLRLLGEDSNEQIIQTKAEELAQNYILDWSAVHRQQTESQKAALKPYLDKYRLSITHLQHFVDTTCDGPVTWLINDLLKFPGPSIPAAAYGSAVHATLNEAQKYLKQNSKQKPMKDLLEDFDKSLKRMSLTDLDFEFYKERGHLGLKAYLSSNYSNFKTDDKSEVNFYADNIVINEARITGLADRVNLVDGDWQSGRIEILDYKTGKAAASWKGKTDFDKIKLHKYKQQLLFYELMLSKSKRFKNLKVNSSKLVFVEPTESEELVSLDLQSTPEEIAHMEKLIQAVWSKIQNVDLPETNQYPATLEGIVKFEEDLIRSV